MGDDSFHVYKKTLVTRKGITWLREILIEGQKAEKICTMNHYKSVE